MSAPVHKFSKLSLETMAPTTRSRARDSLEAATATSQQQQSEDPSSSEVDDSDADSSSDVDDHSPVVRSPTRLLYRIDQLSEEKQTAVREAFSDPPKMTLQRCRRINGTYAFQMTEVVTRSVRIRAPRNGTAQLSCSCGQVSQTTCQHLLWLLDHFAKQTCYDYRPDKPLTMTPDGFAEEAGDPFASIAGHHLNILAESLHCHVVDPEADADDEELDGYRIQEARELLASVYGTPTEDFRPDIFTNPKAGKKILKRDDLDCTVFRMLLDNQDFFQYFLSLTQGPDSIRDTFRSLSRRVHRVLRDLDAASSTASADVSGPSGDDPFTEGPRDVPWAASHVVGCVRLVRSAIYARDRPLQPHEATSAARALVGILEAVVARNADYPAQPGALRQDRNLYLRLVGDRDNDFVVGELSLVPPEAASQFVSSLEAVLDRIGVHGAPASYVEKLQRLTTRLRTPSHASGTKRQGQGAQSGRVPKRMK